MNAGLLLRFPSFYNGIGITNSRVSTRTLTSRVRVQSTSAAHVKDIICFSLAYRKGPRPFRFPFPPLLSETSHPMQPYSFLSPLSH